MSICISKCRIGKPRPAAIRRYRAIVMKRMPAWQTHFLLMSRGSAVNLITTSIHNASCVADALGLGRLGDETTDTDPELLRRIYRHCRNDDGKRVIFERNSTFNEKWVNLDSPAAREIIDVFVPLDDENDLKKARRVARTNLEAIPWNDILGISSPGLRLHIKIHGKRWAMRFESGEPASKEGGKSMSSCRPSRLTVRPTILVTASRTLTNHPQTRRMRRCLNRTPPSSCPRPGCPHELHGSRSGDLLRSAVQPYAAVDPRVCPRSAVSRSRHCDPLAQR